MTLVGDDCYFFLNNGCVRGNLCSFRHQPGAKNNEVCPDWIKGTCIKTTCVLRHHMIDANRAKIQCYWEQQPNGCLKPNCPFLHLKSTATASIGAIATPPVHIVVPKVSPIEGVLPQVSSIVSSIAPVIQNGVVSSQTIGNMQVTNPISNQLPPIVNPHAVPTQSHLMVQSFRSQNLQVPSAPHRKPVLGPPTQNNIFPKSELFTQQVELFKKMLASKNKGGEDNYKEDKYSKNDDEIIDSEFDEANARSRKSRERESRERQRQARKKKFRDENKSRRHGKKSKDNWSKGDDEILYGDYKDVPLDSRYKKRNSDRSPSSEPDVKSYEEILREKALKKLYERRKQKFNNDFEDLVSEKTKHKKSSNDKKEGDRHESRSKSKNKNRSVENTDTEFYSADDAVEIDVDTSPIRDEISPPRKQKKRVEKSNDTLSEKEATPDKHEVEEKEHVKENVTEKGDEVIQIDELISVDDTDDLAQELKLSAETTSNNSNSKKRKGYKKVISSVVVPKNNKSNDKPMKKDTEVNRNVVKNRKEKKIVTVIASPEPVITKISEPVLSPVKAIQNKLKEVKVKSFDEIMAEKKRRKNANDVVVISENKEASSKKSVDKLKETTVKSKIALRENPVASTTSTLNVIVPPTTLKGVTKPQLNRNRLKRLGSNGENEDDKQKRKSLQLYKPPSIPDEAQEIKEVKTVVNTGPRKIIRIQKSVLYPSEKAAIEEKEKNSTNPDKLSGKDGGVKSFEEIMREKRQRQQKEQTEKQCTQPKETFQVIKSRPHRFLKNQVATIIKQKPQVPQTNVQPKTNASKAASGSNKPEEKSSKRTISKSLSTDYNEDELLKDSVPSTPVQPKASFEYENVNEKRGNDTGDQLKNASVNEHSQEEKQDDESLSPPNSIEDIKEALSELQRKREEDLLSDDEFEKEINDLCAGDDDNDDDINDEINDDDLMMELEEMIGS